jgi:uncharacterized protein (DUF1778 family)
MSLRCSDMSKRASKQPLAKPLKDSVIQLRIPAEQKQALSDAAANEGLELSAWLRQVALRAAGLLPERSRK